MSDDLRNRVARAMAYANRQKLDASADADDHWQHTCVETQNMWLKLADAALAEMGEPAPVSVRVAAMQEMADDDRTHAMRERMMEDGVN